MSRLGNSTSIVPALLGALLLGSTGSAKDAAPAGTQGVWSDQFSLPGVFSGRSATVRAFAEFRGDLVVAGKHQLAGKRVVSNIARWDGQGWHPLGDGLDRDCHDLVVFNGDLIAAGTFRAAGGEEALYVARWDGSRWYPMGDGFDFPVDDLFVFQGELYAGGRFRLSGDTRISGLARWKDSVWVPLDEGLKSKKGRPACLTMTEYDGGLVAAGYFDQVNGVPAQNVAWWRDGVWKAFGTGTDGWVTVATTHDGKLILAGGFGLVDGVAVDRLATWDGQAWRPLGAAPRTESLTALFVKGDELFASWTFGVHRWSGSDWEPVPGTEDLYVRRVFSWNDRLVVGGTFWWIPPSDPGAESSSAGHVIVQDGEGWDRLGVDRGLLDPGRNYGDGAIGIVRAMVPWDGGLAVGGTFQYGSGHPIRDLAIVKENKFHGIEGVVGGTIVGGVYAMALFQKELVISGDFSAASTVPSVGSWDGKRWKILDSERAPGHYILTLLADGNDLYAGGRFTSIDGVEALSVAHWRDGTWHPLGLGLGGNGGRPVVNSLAKYRDRLIVSGRFGLAGGEIVSNVAAWDGTSWSELGRGVNYEIQTFHVWDGDLWAAGAFTRAGRHASDGIARWNGDEWQPLPSPGFRARDFHEYQGDLYASGPGRVSRWNGDGWVSIGSVLGTPLSLETVDDRLWVGGDFSGAGPYAAYGLTSWQRSPADVALKPGPGRPRVPLASPVRLRAEARGTTVELSLLGHADGVAIVEIFDVLGRRVRRLEVPAVDDGGRRVSWDRRSESGAEVAAGIYFVRASIGDLVASTKVRVLR